MGQGLFNMLGYGVLEAPTIPDDPHGEKWDSLDAGWTNGVRSRYECRQDFIVVPLAVDDEWMRDYYELLPLPDSILRCTPRTARYADDVEWDVPASVRSTWVDLQKRFAGIGVQLPEPRFVVLNDWS